MKELKRGERIEKINLTKQEMINAIKYGFRKSSIRKMKECFINGKKYYNEKFVKITASGAYVVDTTTGPHWIFSYKELHSSSIYRGRGLNIRDMKKDGGVEVVYEVMKRKGFIKR